MHTLSKYDISSDRIYVYKEKVNNKIIPVKDNKLYGKEFYKLINNFL